MKAWIDGTIMDTAEARIPVSDHGLLYGDGVFEGIRLYKGRIFRLVDHLKRLEVSAKAIALRLPVSLMEMEKIVCETARATGLDDGYIRLIVTRGDGPLGVDPTACVNPRIICIVDRLEIYSDERRRRGLSLITSSLRQPNADALDPRVKSLCYLNSVLAKREASAQGADEALMLNSRGQIAEAAVANVFAVNDGHLYTPPASDGALAGITRATVLELALRLGIPATERSLDRVDLWAADEVFLSGTGVRIAPVRLLDGQTTGRVPGPVTEQLHQAFLLEVETRGVAI